MNEQERQEVIDFINRRYDEDIPGPVKFVIKRKAKKIEKLNPEDFPQSFRDCTLEELLVLIKEAYVQKKLKF